MKNRPMSTIIYRCSAVAAGLQWSFADKHNCIVKDRGYLRRFCFSTKSLTWTAAT